MVRVAIDGRRLQDDPKTGVGRGLYNMLPHLAEQIELVLLTDRRRPAVAGGWDQVPLFGWGKLPEPVWLHASAGPWLRRFGGVFHGTYNALPFTYHGPSVVSIHDLSWEHHPEDLGEARRVVMAAQARWSAKRAEIVATGSEYIRAELISTYGLTPDRVVVARQAVDPVFSPDRSESADVVLDRLGVDRPYVVAIGGAKRRGLSTAVAAWRQLTGGKGRPNLVVVGNDTLPPEPGLFCAGRVDDPTWSALLAGAEVFCYPTRYEGFGMPAFESAACGVPVVCAPVGSLPEVLGDAAEWSDSTEVEDVAAALDRVISDRDRRQELSRAGLARVEAAPKWPEIARVTADAYRRAYQEAAR